MNRFLTIVALAILTGFCSSARAPSFAIRNHTVVIDGVTSNNPVLYDNDWWTDVFDNKYLWARASLGLINLQGQIVTRDMWNWQQGYLYTMEQCRNDARNALRQARLAGLRNLPEPVPGADRVLRPPPSGRIEDTQPLESHGSRLIIEQARKAQPHQPLLLICGGPLTTVANALLLAPDIADRIVVFNLTVSDGGYNGKDAWSAYIVCKRTRYVDWGGGAFWDRDSIFEPAHFDVLPDNPLTREMKRFIRSDLGRANQLGDGAPLVWLFDPACWKRAELRSAAFRDGILRFEPCSRSDEADLLVIPKDATDLSACRREFFRVFLQPGLFPSSNR